MAAKSGPYIGVTGFMSQAEVFEALLVVPPVSLRRLMVGVLMGTLNGEQNKWPGRYPKKEAIGDIFVESPYALNLIHYNTDQPTRLLSQLFQITDLVGADGFDGFQLNIAWPPISQVRDYWEAYPDKYLLLQIGSRAMGQIESAERFAELLGAYLPMINSILIDPSGGKGLPLDAGKCREYLQVASEFHSLDLGVAGGLGPETLDLVDPLLEEFPGLSIDVEGKVRTQQPEDKLDLAAMRTYISQAFAKLDGK